MGYQPDGDQEEIGRQLDGGVPDSRRARADQLFHLPPMSELRKKLDLAAVRAAA